MKLAFLKLGKKTVASQFFENFSNNIIILLA